MCLSSHHVFKSSFVKRFLFSSWQNTMVNTRIKIVMFSLKKSESPWRELNRTPLDTLIISAKMIVTRLKWADINYEVNSLLIDLLEIIILLLPTHILVYIKVWYLNRHDFLHLFRRLIRQCDLMHLNLGPEKAWLIVFETWYIDAKFLHSLRLKVCILKRSPFTLYTDNNLNLK